MLTRSKANPIITREHFSKITGECVDPSSVFNPGACYFNGKYHLILRVQARSRETYMYHVESDNGEIFSEPTLITFQNEPEFPKAYHLYDPRLTVIDGVCYIMFAADFDGFCGLGVAKTSDFAQYEFLGYTQGDYLDTRNGVLFPEKINGKYMRLERPNLPTQENSPTSGDTITLSSSDDLIQWQHEGEVMQGRWHYWDERIGAGPPPIKTKHGWLVIYHGVATHFASSNIYQAGVVLLDLEDPTKVLARTRHNILEPREMYELVGQVPNVVFPSGAIVETDNEGFASDDAEVLVYYGAADTSVALAKASVGDLIASCASPDEFAHR